ncbi:MAG: glycosyltransferase [Kiritimatiellia bacterium]
MIFWINSPFDPLPLEGGRALRYELLARALTVLGHKVVWWSSDFHHLRKMKRSMDPVYAVDGYQVRLVPTLPYRFNVGLKRILSHCRYASDWRMLADDALKSGELEPPDAIVVSMPPLGLFDVAAHFRTVYGCRIIVDVQDAWPENFYALIPRVPRFLLKRLFSCFERTAQRAYIGADAISAVSRKYLQLAESYGSDVPSQVFPLGGTLPELEIKRRNGRERTLRLIYVGNLGASYDLRTMLEGVGNLIKAEVDVVLEIAGDGPERKFVASFVERFGDRMRYHGYLDERQLDAVMRDCDVGIIPMRSEMLVAVPNKLIDYSGYGLAVINGLASETAELLERYGCGVNYETGSLQSFEGAVRCYEQDREMLARHRESARRLAEERFDANKISAAMARWIVERVKGI